VIVFSILFMELRLILDTKLIFVHFSTKIGEIMQVIKDPNLPPIKIWANLNEVEDGAIQQLKNVASLPFIFRHIAVMPDVHVGYGATIGSVIATQGAVCPSAVGVDIGCGMLAVNLNKSLNDFNMKEVFDTIENVVPVGFKGHEHGQSGMGHILRESASIEIKKVWKKAEEQTGTLGGGNHFVELCDDGSGNAWLMLHSGSRGTGNKLAQGYIKRAKELMKIWHIELADPDLAYLAEKTPEFDNYIRDVLWCQQYAFMNRQTMLDNILRAFDLVVENSDIINCHHNYIAIENHFNSNVIVTRKGAVRARSGDIGIIPGSMGTKSYIVKGKGNPESFCSCSHGAGRVMSRTKAKATFTVQDLAAQTEGVICRKDEDIIDEIPAAYKDLDKVMENQSDLVEILHTLKAVVCVKG